MMYKNCTRLMFLIYVLSMPVFLGANNMRIVCQTPELRADLKAFLDNMLPVVPSHSFVSLVDDVLQRDQQMSSHELYELLSHRIATVQPWNSMYRKLSVIQRQKKILGRQACQLLNGYTHIDGCVEIGSPGTYLAEIGKSIPVYGSKYVVNDAQKITDRAQAFSLSVKNRFLAYDHFVPLKEYAPLSSDAIADNSVDLVICFVGLHHVPFDKLDNFIASIHRVLRPGGLFLLRDHDCVTSDVTSVVHAAHTAFNLIVDGASAKQEKQELRNFQSLSYWVDILSAHGFEVSPDRLQQQGDPTLNTMIASVKKVESVQSASHVISPKIKKKVVKKGQIAQPATKAIVSNSKNDSITQEQAKQETQEQILSGLKNKEEYRRDLVNSYLTSPEWLNVDISQEYGNFINHTPFYEFPYLQSVITYWQVFFQSWRAAARKKGHVAVLTSPYTHMNLFVGIMMSAEYGLKSCVSLPVRLLFSGAESEHIQVLLVASKEKVAQVNAGIKIIDVYDDGKLCLVALPRYKKFLPMIMKLAQANIPVLQIAGNKEIQYKVRYKKDSSFAHSNQFNGFTKEYEWVLPTQPDYVYGALTVSVSEIGAVHEYLESHGVEILYIHDY